MESGEYIGELKIIIDEIIQREKRIAVLWEREMELTRKFIEGLKE